MKKCLLLLGCLFVFLYACDSDPVIIDEIEKEKPLGDVTLKLDTDTVTFSAMKKNISVIITIGNYSDFGKLGVVKRGTAIDTIGNYLSNEIDSIYQFSYEIKETDEELFELGFIAYKLDNTVAAMKTVLVADASLPFNQVKLELSADTLVYNEENKNISVKVFFEKLYNLKELQIKRKDKDADIIVDYADIDSLYIFNYAISEDDPERFVFTFNAIDQNNKLTSTKELFVSEEGIVIKNLVRLSRVTGKMLAGERFYSPNRTDERYDLGGTDLGIMWEMEPGKVGVFFGDSYGADWVTTPGGGPGVASNWRSNVLAFSDDKQLDDGMKFSGMAVGNNGSAKEIIYSAKQGTDFTSIPTGAIRVKDVDYVHYFNLRAWDPWTINYSSLYSSSDNGVTWKSRKEITFGTNSRFAMIGYAKKDGYVYMIGTPSGRLGKPYLARFLEDDILKKSEYEYWNGIEKQWIKNDENRATPLWNKNVGELSFFFHEKYKRWIIAYSAGEGDIHAMLFRDAKELTGPWTKAKILVDGGEYPGLYGPFIHPVKNKEDKLYFNMSQWWPYNVYFMKVDMTVYQ